MNISDSSVFDLSPIPLWVEDYSCVKAQFDLWRQQGITDLRQFLEQDLQRVTQCAHQIKIVKVNQKALDQLAARDLQHLRDNLDIIFQKQMFNTHITELVALWEGQTEFTSTTINYSLHGQVLDIKLRGVVLPGYEQDLAQVLISTEDISAYQQARRLAESRFTYSPCALFVEDFSRVKTNLDQLRDIGIEDFRTFLDVHPEFVQQCIDDILLLDVNQASLELFKAPDKASLFLNLNKIFAYETLHTFREQLIELWDGRIHHQREAINYALDGSIRNVLLQFTVFPGHEHDWSLVQIALTDITARKKAENYLEYLGKHDVLTKLFNRSFFTEELNRLEKNIVRPVSAVFIDMNGLKYINDHYGHDSGDALLRRIGNIINRSIRNTPYNASRVGGDEFIIFMPGANDSDVSHLKLSIEELLSIDNQYYSSQPISLSIGHATTIQGESIEDMLKRADQVMYQQKQQYYSLKINQQV